jgi:predicted nucleotidyltransferase
MPSDRSVDAALARVLARCEAPDLLAGRRLLAIWLFGSHARGEARPDSDIDLRVLCDPPLGIAARAGPTCSRAMQGSRWK